MDVLFFSTFFRIFKWKIQILREYFCAKNSFDALGEFPARNFSHRKRALFKGLNTHPLLLKGQGKKRERGTRPQEQAGGLRTFPACPLEPKNGLNRQSRNRGEHQDWQPLSSYPKVVDQNSAVDKILCSVCSQPYYGETET